MDAIHWLGVILALPAFGVVLSASWRSFVQQRADRRLQAPRTQELQR